ncbi:MAG: response regulator [Ignavibacteria bacterium]|jgi:CheY-like chemotaxis protein|nr:response regulator [Ignavibacteria bacterium]
MFETNSALIIDDDTWTQRVLVKIVNKIGLTDTLLASNGIEGINMTLNNRPDVIFLDMMMPVLDGKTTLKILKGVDITKNIPIIIVTANSDVDNIASVVTLGASDFVAKPFTIDTISAKLERVLVAVNKRKELIKNDSNLNSYSHEDYLNSREYNFEDENFEDEFVSKFNILGEPPEPIDGVDAAYASTKQSDSVKRYKQDSSEYRSEIQKILKK